MGISDEDLIPYGKYMAKVIPPSEKQTLKSKLIRNRYYTYKAGIGKPLFL